MRNSIVLFFSIFFLLTISCTSNSSKQDSLRRWMQKGSNLKVLATTAMVGDVVKNVGGDAVDVHVLIQGELDPHSYEPVKGDNEKFQRAELIFYNGLQLEHGPTLEKFLLNSSKAHSLGDFLKKERPEAILFADGVEDPHIWMDMSLWKETAKHVERVLADRLPAKKELFHKNRQGYEGGLTKAHERFLKVLQEIPEHKRYLVTSHDAFHYFTRAYLATEEERLKGGWEDRCEAPEGLAPEGQLSSADIRYVVEFLKRKGVFVIFPESNVSRAALEKISEVGKQEGLSISIAQEPLYGDSMGPGSYEDMLQSNIETISKHLRR